MTLYQRGKIDLHSRTPQGCRRAGASAASFSADCNKHWTKLENLNRQGLFGEAVDWPTRLSLLPGISILANYRTAGRAVCDGIRNPVRPLPADGFRSRRIRIDYRAGTGRRSVRGTGRHWQRSIRSHLALRDLPARQIHGVVTAVHGPSIERHRRFAADKKPEDI